MFISLTRILLWGLIGYLIYYLLLRAFPAQSAIGRVLIVLLLVLLLLAFLAPTDGVVASLWRVLSFPLKPLGASILLLFLSAQGFKGGAIQKGGLVVWALVILLLASTPAFAYLLTRLPTVTLTAMERLGEPIAQNVSLSSSLVPAAQTSGGMLAFAQETRDRGDSIVYASQLDLSANSATLAFNPVDVTSITRSRDFYLLQVQDIPRRGLQLVDFVPSAETLYVTTQIWEQYLGSIFFFLRGQQVPPPVTPRAPATFR